MRLDQNTAKKKDQYFLLIIGHPTSYFDSYHEAIAYVDCVTNAQPVTFTDIVAQDYLKGLK